MKRNREILEGLVAIEGIDGAGTTTLARNLTNILEAAGRNVVPGCEPTDGPIGQIIREGLSGRLPMAPESLALLFAADRREHLYGKDGIISIVSNGGIYVTDRYLFSSLAYQSLDCSWEWVDGLNSAYPLPEYLIYLGLPVDEAMKRISGRGEQDIFETESLQQQVADSYDRSIQEYAGSGMKVLVLDSRRSPKDISSAAGEFILSE